MKTQSGNNCIFTAVGEHLIALTGLSITDGCLWLSEVVVTVKMCICVCLSVYMHVNILYVCICGAFRPLCFPAVGLISKTPSNTFTQQRSTHLTQAPDAENTEPTLAGKVKYMI